VLAYIFLGFFLYLVYIFFNSKSGKNAVTFKNYRKKTETIEFDHISHALLNERVEFYSRLSGDQQTQFRKDVAWFLSHTRIIGIGLEVGDLERHLVAASAVIPIFHFEDWHFYELDEVLLYTGPINFQFETDAFDSQILGMVGTGKMEGKMALSIQALYDGFDNKTDKHNTAIHEFIHLLDKADGRIDGLPKALMTKPYAIPWLNLIRHKMEKVKTGNSDIDEYAGLNLAEFFAVSSEYFFERPELLQRKHPDLYNYLDKMFKGKLK
jgi:Mlc titration factor MtfA (ptsG expression regulator)